MAQDQAELIPFANPAAVEPPVRPGISADDPLSALRGPFSAHMERKEFSNNTVRSFLSDLDLLIVFLGPDTRLADTTVERLQDFIHNMEHGHASPKSIDRRITTLKVLFGWLAKANVIIQDPAAPLIHRRAKSRPPQILYQPQIDAVLTETQMMRNAEISPDARPDLLITLLLSTGIKKAECMRLRLDQIDLSTPEQPTVYIHYDKPRQRHKSRRLALPADWTETLDIYLRRYQPETSLFECTPRNLEYVLHNLSEITHLATNMTFEMLRWTSAVHHYREGMSPDRLRRRLGLSPISWRETQATLEILSHQAP